MAHLAYYILFSEVLTQEFRSGLSLSSREQGSQCMFRKENFTDLHILPFYFWLWLFVGLFLSPEVCQLVFPNHTNIWFCWFSVFFFYLVNFCYLLLPYFHFFGGFILIALFEMLLRWLSGCLIFWNIFLGYKFPFKSFLSNIILVLICGIFIMIQLKILSLNHIFKLYFQIYEYNRMF